MRLAHWCAILRYLRLCTARTCVFVVYFFDLARCARLVRTVYWVVDFRSFAEQLIRAVERSVEKALFVYSTHKQQTQQNPTASVVSALVVVLYRNSLHSECLKLLDDITKEVSARTARTLCTAVETRLQHPNNKPNKTQQLVRLIVVLYHSLLKR